MPANADKLSRIASERRHALRRAAGLLALLVFAAPGAHAAELKKKTLDAFHKYVELTEARVEAELREGNPFLWVDAQPEARRAAYYAQLRRGELVIESFETRGADRKKIDIPDGMVHHWVGVVFIPGATLARTLAQLTDYDNHATTFAPDVQQSRLLSRDGTRYKIFLRFYKKKVLTVILNTNHDAVWEALDERRAYSTSRTTRIAEVDNAGKADGRELPVGNDGGYLWRLNTYWRLIEKDGGTYVQCESVSLTRDVPFGLGWLIGPFIKSVPRESLEHTLLSARKALTR